MWTTPFSGAKRTRAAEGQAEREGKGRAETGQGGRTAKKTGRRWRRRESPSSRSCWCLLLSRPSRRGGVETAGSAAAAPGQDGHQGEGCLRPGHGWSLCHTWSGATPGAMSRRHSSPRLSMPRPPADSECTSSSAFLLLHWSFKIIEKCI